MSVKYAHAKGRGTIANWSSTTTQAGPFARTHEELNGHSLQPLPKCVRWSTVTSSGSDPPCSIRALDVTADFESALKGGMSANHYTSGRRRTKKLKGI